MSDTSVTIRVPVQVASLLGPDPGGTAREALLLQLVHDGRVTLGYAARILGLDDTAAAKWYTSHGYTHPRLTPRDFTEGVTNALGVMRAGAGGR